MNVDKTLSSIKAVQTLSRLNRAHPQKHDVFVLDFLNGAEHDRLDPIFYVCVAVNLRDLDENG